MTELALIDHHVHGAVTATLDGAGVQSLLMETPFPAPPGTSAFDSQLGFAVRRWCAPVLDLEPSVPAAVYLERRAKLGSDEVTERLLRAADVQAWLVDTGYQSDEVQTPGELAGASGALYSILPPENATGNYVKVVERIPVKIVFDHGQDPKHPLRPGMSVEPSVKVQ